MAIDSSENIVIKFAQTLARSDRQLFGINPLDRLPYLYIIGKTGTGKSTILKTMIRQDIIHGNDYIHIDPQKGGVVNRIASFA